VLVFLTRESPNRCWAATIGRPTSRSNGPLTQFWVRLVAHVIEAFPGAAQFDAALACFPRLRDNALPYRHYRQVTLGSEDARRRYVEPDLLPMP